ncbi:hypothetical protein, partial [Alterinioella nitratireducens]
MSSPRPGEQITQEAVRNRRNRYSKRLSAQGAGDNPLRLSLAADFLATGDPNAALNLCNEALACDPANRTAADLVALMEGGLRATRDRIQVAKTLLSDGHYAAADSL